MARILYVSDGYSTHDFRFLDKLAASPHDIWFLPMTFNAGVLEQRPLPQRVTLAAPLGKSRFGFWGCVARFRSRLKTIQPDIVHAGPVQTGAFYAAACGAHPLLVMSWGSDVLVKARESRWQFWKSRYALRRADVVFADCDAVKTETLRLTAPMDKPFVLFPWGVDLRLFSPGAPRLGLREKLGWQNAFVVLGTRGFEPIHAPFVFLKAIAKAVRENPALRFILSGTGSQQAQAAQWISEHGLESIVHLPGQIKNTELPDYFREADVYASSTLSDGSSISLLEAMACARPAIVVDAFGNKEWVTPGLHGWRTPPGDADALAGAFLSAAQLPKEERAAMGSRNRAVVEKRANWNENFKRLLETYDEMLNHKEARHARI